MWNTIRKWCNPTILDKDTLMSEDDVFMNKDLIREECQCEKKATCLAIIDLLNNNKPNEAMKLIDWM